MTPVHERIDWNGVRRRLPGLQELDGNRDSIDADRMNEILHQRAVRLAQRRRDSNTSGKGAAFLTFQLASQRFGIGLTFVKQVFPQVPITPVPGADKLLLGVANLNGSLRSVVDLRVLLNLPAEEAESGYIILLRANRTLLGIWAEAVDGIIQIDPEQLTAVNEAASDSIGRMSLGVTDDRTLALDATLLIERVSDQVRPRNAGSS